MPITLFWDGFLIDSTLVPKILGEWCAVSRAEFPVEIVFLGRGGVLAAF